MREFKIQIDGADISILRHALENELERFGCPVTDDLTDGDRWAKARGDAHPDSFLGRLLRFHRALYNAQNEIPDGRVEKV